MPDRHRWAVDALHESAARVEEDGERMLTVPRWLLPTTAREGDVLAVVRRPDGRSGVTIDVVIDREATRAARERATAQVDQIARESRAKDRPGDVEL